MDPVDRGPRSTPAATPSDPDPSGVAPAVDDGAPAEGTGRLSAFLLRWAPLGVALPASLASTFSAHWNFVLPYATPVGYDEGYITALGHRLMLGHWLPYVDGISQRGPVTYWLAAIAMRIGGVFSWMPMRWLAVGLSCGVLVLLALLAVELFSPMAAAIAVLAAAYFANYELNPRDGIGYNGENAAMPFVLLSALLLARVMKRRVDPGPTTRRDAWSRAAWLAASGALVAIGALSKQIALIHAVPGALWLALGPTRTGEDVGGAGAPRPRWYAARLRDLVAYGVGFTAPFAVVLAIYGATGHLRDFIYYYQRYGRDVYMAPITWKFASEAFPNHVAKYSFGIAAVSSVVLLAVARTTRSFLAAPMAPVDASDERAHARWTRTLTRAQASGPELFALLHFFGATVGATFPVRFFGHYYLEFYPFFGLVAGYAFSMPLRGLHRREDGPSPLLGRLVVVLGAALLLFMADRALHRTAGWRRGHEPGAGDKWWDRWFEDPKNDPMVRYVLANTKPTDTIFVWGFRSELHVSAHRFPASRFVYSIYPSGFVPWFHDSLAVEARRVVPGSQELMLSDLEASAPKLVIDSGGTMYHRYMKDIPIFRRYLEQRYCYMGTIEEDPIYRRRVDRDCPPPDTL
jgi:hypothetical protein